MLSCMMSYMFKDFNLRTSACPAVSQVRSPNEVGSVWKGYLECALDGNNPWKERHRALCCTGCCKSKVRTVRGSFSEAGAFQIEPKSNLQESAKLCRAAPLFKAVGQNSRDIIPAGTLRTSSSSCALKLSEGGKKLARSCGPRRKGNTPRPPA